jgi:hypothetical protein
VRPDPLPAAGHAGPVLPHLDLALPPRRVGSSLIA